MTLPAELQPKTKARVMDLFERAGLDVSDWPNYKGGARNPSANPKYCYEWALSDHGKFVVCNLWYANMKEVGNSIEQHLTLKDTPKNKEPDATRRARRSRMEQLLSNAYQQALPVRVIVLDGDINSKSLGGRSKVGARTLDPDPWAVISHDAKTGAVILRRGASAQKYSDQFSLPIPPDGTAEYRKGVTTIRNRSAAIRQYALQRAQGKCEYCGTPGFKHIDQSIFLETHHIVPLSEDGLDSALNVVALCPNHHREAHHGHAASQMQASLLLKIEKQ